MYLFKLLYYLNANIFKVIKLLRFRIFQREMPPISRRAKQLKKACEANLAIIKLINAAVYLISGGFNTG